MQGTGNFKGRQDWKKYRNLQNWKITKIKNSAVTVAQTETKSK